MAIGTYATTPIMENIVVDLPDMDATNLSEALTEINDKARKKIFVITFRGDKNKFASRYEKGNDGDDHPLLIPGNCVFKGIVYTNKKNVSDVDFRIYKNGTNNASIISILQMRDKRVYSNMDVNINYAAGDLFYLYLRDRGTDLDSAVIDTFWETETVLSGIQGINSI